MEVIDVVAAVITNKNGEVLIARRGAHKSLPGKWEFPGGKVESEEIYESALERELLEEFNIQTRTIGYIGQNMHVYEHVAINLLAYKSEIIAGEIILTDHDIVEWVDKKDLENFDLAPADIPLITLL